MRLTRSPAARPLAVLALAVLALAGGLPPGGARAADDPAVAPVRRLYDRVEQTLKGGTPDLNGRVEAVGPTLTEVFDVPAMLPLAVGPKWKGFKPEQQAAVSEAFGPYFTTLYANRLSQAEGGRFEVGPNAQARGGNRVVHTKVTTREGDESDVDYVVDADNRIQDVLLNGNVSEIASMRASFAEPLKKGGAEGLAKFMTERTRGMLAAKPKP